MSRQRKKRNRGGFILVIIEIILGIIILAMILGAAAYYFCPLKDVAVEGTDLYSSSEITEYILDDKYSSNTVYAFFTYFP